MCSRGITSTCVGAAGLMSRNAYVRSVASTFVDGTSPATIRQNRQPLIGSLAFGSLTGPNATLGTRGRGRPAGRGGRPLPRRSGRVDGRGPGPRRGRGPGQATLAGAAGGRGGDVHRAGHRPGRTAAAGGGEDLDRLEPPRPYPG